ncbi:hypothetical protein ACQ1ZI_14960, partial [Enterococcus faecalis]|uniref:hypothetical protein n=1 Tax=Enterococcus faecalis TaxID=1351 RepID=UPI003D6BF39E
VHKNSKLRMHLLIINKKNPHVWYEVFQFGDSKLHTSNGGKKVFNIILISCYFSYHYNIDEDTNSRI